MLLSAVEMDFENEVIYTMRFVNSSIYLYKVNYPIFSVGLTDSIEETLELPEVTVIATSTFAAVSTYYYCFLDGHNGYWYGFANKANSSGDAELLWVKISKEDYSITEGSWTLSNVTMTYTGYRTGYNVSNQYIRNKSIIRNGYLYVMSYDCTGIYKINLDDSADVTLIDLGFTSEDLNMNGSSTTYGGQWYYLIEDVIIAYDFIILADDTIIQTAGAKKFSYTGSPMFIYKNFFVHWGRIWQLCDTVCRCCYAVSGYYMQPGYGNGKDGGLNYEDHVYVDGNELTIALMAFIQEGNGRPAEDLPLLVWVFSLCGRLLHEGVLEPGTGRIYSNRRLAWVLYRRVR